MRLTILVVCMLMLGVARAEEEKAVSIRFENYKPLSEGIQKAGTLVVYHGLPRTDLQPPRPPGTPEPEKVERKTIQIHGYTFYAEAFTVNEKDTARLKEIYATPALFSAWTAPKPCGGFHPNYLLEWKDGEKVYQVLLCYGCQEAKTFGPGVELHCNVDEKALRAMSDVLKNLDAPKAK